MIRFYLLRHHYLSAIGVFDLVAVVNVRALSVPSRESLESTCPLLEAFDAGRFPTGSTLLEAILGREMIFGMLCNRVWDLGFGFSRLKKIEFTVSLNFFSFPESLCRNFVEHPLCRISGNLTYF